VSINHVKTLCPDPDSTSIVIGSNTSNLYYFTEVSYLFIYVTRYIF